MEEFNKAHWTESKGIYFINLPTEITDEGGGKLKCSYAPIERQFYDHTKGNAIFAKEILPANAYIPYGGREEPLSADEQSRISKNNVPKYGGESRTFYWADLPTHSGKYLKIDAHPRHAREAKYPEDCCWPGSQINTAFEGEDEKINCELVYLSKKEASRHKNLPKYPYIHHHIYAKTLRAIGKGEELLTRYGWTKNTMTRIFGPLKLKPSGHRKEARFANEDEVAVAENSAMVRKVLAI